ncbi:MAG: twin-arginine translocase subunit TatC [Bacteroidota bacterium]
MLKLNTKRKRKKKEEKKKPEAEMSFLEHLEELRWHLIRSFAAIVVLGIGVFLNIKTVVDQVFLKPFESDFPLHRFLCNLQESLCFEEMPVDFIVIAPYEQFLKSISVSLICGFILSFPYFIWEMWRFIKPGLHDHEQKSLRGTVFITSLLFFIGVGFAYYIVAPFSAQFLSNYNISDQIQNQWRMGAVITMVSQIVLAGGVLFELPIIVYYLSKMGILTPKLMRTYRRHSIVVLMLLSAVITPPDALTMILIFIPLFFLYEISIRISAVTNKKREKELAQELGMTTTDNGQSGDPS